MARRKIPDPNELVLSAAIVGILAIALFPLLAQAKRLAARQADQLGRGQRLALGVQLYLGDHDQVFPYGCGEMGWKPADGGWVQSVVPYVAPRTWHKWLLSPDDPRRQASWPSWMVAMPDAVNISFAANANMRFDAATGTWGIQGLMGLAQASWLNPVVTSYGEVSYPEETVMIAEAYNCYPLYMSSDLITGQNWWDDMVGFGSLIPDPTRDGSPYMVNGFVHNVDNRYGAINSVVDGKSKFLWADGHISRTSPLSTNPDPSNLSANLWEARRP